MMYRVLSWMFCWYFRLYREIHYAWWGAKEDVLGPNWSD